MKDTFTPVAMRGPYWGEPEYEFLKERAKECLLFKMSPEYWDSMTDKEHYAWVEAYNELQKEIAEATKD